MIESICPAEEDGGGQEARKEVRIGGQAVIEGVVMRGPEKWALSVRKPSGDIVTTVNPADTLAQRYPGLDRFGLRGILVLIDSMIIGIKSLSVSAGIALEEAEAEQALESAETLIEEPGVPEDEEALQEAREAAAVVDAVTQSGKVTGWEITVALLLAVVLFLGLFIVLPTVIAKTMDRYIGNTVVYNLVEGGLRIAIFVLYLTLISLMPDIKRVFMYHGAEHKVVHAYEDGLPLTPESAGSFSTAHVRCGTTFILVVLVVSVLAFSLFGRPALWLRVLERLAVIPLVAAISYEIIRLAGRYEDSLATRIIMAPGLLLQKLTTREPDERQLEVAIEALTEAVRD